MMPFQMTTGSMTFDLDSDLYTKNSFFNFIAYRDIVFYKFIVFEIYFYIRSESKSKVFYRLTNWM